MGYVVYKTCMGNIVSRPKNEELGIESVSARVPVMMKPSEKAKLTALADKRGFKISTFIRVKMLEIMEEAERDEWPH